MAGDSDLAIKQFDTITRYYAFETSMYWTRSHFYMVANAGLLALAASYLLEPTLDHPYILAMVCLLGVFLSVSWLLVLRAGQFWADRWEKICIGLEPAAMGQVEVFRNCRPGGHVSTKKIARITSSCFIVIWLALCAISIASNSVIKSSKTDGQPNSQFLKK